MNPCYSYLIIIIVASCIILKLILLIQSLMLRHLSVLPPKFFSPTLPLQVSLRFCSQKPSKPQTLQLYKKLYQICKPQSKKYFSTGLITLINAAIFMYLPTIYEDLSLLTSLKVSETSTELIYQSYLVSLGKWGGIFGFMGFMTYFRRYQFLDISNRIGIRFRTVLYDHILTKDFYRKNKDTQRYVHHLVTDIKTISEFTGEMVFMGLRGILMLTGGTCCLLYYSPYLSVISIAIMSLFNLLFRGRNARLKQLKERENMALIRITSFVSEKFQSLRLIKISNTEYFEKFLFAKELMSFYKKSRKVAMANGLNFGFLQGLGLFSLFSVAASGSLLISLQISNFSLAASSTYALYVALGFRAVISFNTQLMKMMAIYSNVEQKLGQIHTHKLYSMPFLEESMKQLETTIKQLERQRYEPNSQGISIKCQNLWFSYEQDDQVVEIYDDFNLDIQPGEVVAIVGPSGSGKSTLLNLITKLSDPNKGEIYVDGNNVKQLNFKDIQRMVSYVTQENYLFKGTIEENLKYGNQHFDCSQERLMDCLKLTNAEHFVLKKGGLQTAVEEKGANFSGGEKQRLILARALVKKPRLLLLDEGTTGIDSTSEKIIIENLRENRNEFTTILITHKLQPFEPILTKKIVLKGHSQ